MYVYIHSRCLSLQQHTREAASWDIFSVCNSIFAKQLATSRVCCCILAKLNECIHMFLSLSLSFFIYTQIHYISTHIYIHIYIYTFDVSASNSILAKLNGCLCKSISLSLSLYIYTYTYDIFTHIYVDTYTTTHIFMYIHYRRLSFQHTYIIYIYMVYLHTFINIYIPHHM